MRRTWLVVLPALVLILLMNMGCASIGAVALLGAGKNATKEDTGFLSSYDNLQEGKLGEPDLYYVADGVDWNKFKTISVSDFSSLTTNHMYTNDLQNAYFKNIRKDLADTMCYQLDGSSFNKCKRIESRLDPKNIADIKNATTDIVLLGNIKELRSFENIFVAEFEVKIVEKKTGREILKFVNRQNTGKDQIARPLVRKLLKALDLAREKSKGIDA